MRFTNVTIGVLKAKAYFGVPFGGIFGMGLADEGRKKKESHDVDKEEENQPLSSFWPDIVPKMRRPLITIWHYSDE